MDIIQLDELTKIYHTGLKRGNITALNEVSLSVPQGEIFGLLGPNGAGKTTMVKILLGITSASSGRAWLNGLPVSDPSARQKVGYLAESHQFPHHLTGADLLRLAGKLSGMEAEERENRIDELLPKVGMDRWADVKLKRYSKGMLQRIGLAQAMINDPDLLLLDEPTDGVDPVGKADIRKVLEKLRSEGKTIFLNTHLLAEVEPIADRVAILSKGRLMKVDTVKNLTRRGSQYEIKAHIGHHIIEVPEKAGRVLKVSTEHLIVEVVSDAALNEIIDRVRLKEILITEVRPLTVSLEQSFFEAIDHRPEAGQ